MLLGSYAKYIKLYATFVIVEAYAKLFTFFRESRN